MKIKIWNLDPSKNLLPQDIYNQYYFRKTNKFIGNSFIGIGNVKTAFWWNRPLKEENLDYLTFSEETGYSLNMPLFDYLPKWKSNYNILINKHNAPTIIHLAFKNKLSEEEKIDLSKVTTKAIFATLKALNISEWDFGVDNNDLLLKNKKICGSERITYENIFEEDLCLTLKYKEEKYLFDKLTYGKIKTKKEISGIFDEINIPYDKEAFLELYRKNLEKSINEFLDKYKNTNELLYVED